MINMSHLQFLIDTCIKISTIESKSKKQFISLSYNVNDSSKKSSNFNSIHRHLQSLGSLLLLLHSLTQGRQDLPSLLKTLLPPSLLVRTNEQRPFFGTLDQIYDQDEPTLRIRLLCLSRHWQLEWLSLNPFLVLLSVVGN